MTSARALWAALAGLAAIACGPIHGSTDGPDLGGAIPARLRVEPTSASTTVTLGAATPEIVSYRALLDDGHGVETDVTSAVSWSIDAGSIGFINGSGAANGIAGGTTRVHAAKDGLVADAELHVFLAGAVYGPGTDASTAARFGSATPDATPGNAPALEYPEDGVVLPANIPPIEVQWTQAADNDTYRVRLHADGVVDVFAYGLAREVLIPPATWQLIRDSVHDVPTELSVEALNASNQLRKSPTRTLTITADTIDQSAIYVWRSSTGSFRIIDIASGKDIALPTPAPLLQEGQACSGCHRISRDGTRFGFTYTGEFNLGTLKFDPVSKTFAQSVAPSGALRGTYVAFDPEEGMRVPGMITTVPDIVPQNTAGNVRLEVLHADTGTPLASDIGSMIGKLPAASGPATLMPDWSPDGNFVVFSVYDSNKSFVRMLGDDVVLASLFEASVSFDGAMYHFGDPKPLVVSGDTDADSGQNNILPAISPDGTAVAFTPCPGVVVDQDPAEPAQPEWRDPRGASLRRARVRVGEGVAGGVRAHQQHVAAMGPHARRALCVDRVRIRATVWS